ncbi:hypothetical protein GOC57_29715 [Sinorhizobium meliloti]|uniref:PD-(D/E)XK nuclease superfamily protein n=2 Tax=Sinorhizobium TaxID=28105 RepID=A6UKM6_SINMW|nr:hypothetical protein Smed_5444 [Sinorhizobium medicae WSM419]MDW9378097.1 hypothetical protein [Sinorhizobium meliloti]MDW9496407.1 hypothetical protein [Sinorhizobium meliloti]MDW9564928.1 hypothetical protein [Sinorhizobium meliloti]MDW9652453.1 hypothetical protein [Sinorhizobium meliloti]
MEFPRKSVQEVEIDHLLAEEFACDQLFAQRFLVGCGLGSMDFATTTVIVEPSLGGEGFGDLLIQGEVGANRVALLIEDKISAAPGVRQAKRYHAYAERLRAQGWDAVWTILVAPAGYTGERKSYDASIDLELVETLIVSKNTRRQDYRRSIIHRAIRKRTETGVKIPDEALHRMKSEYLEFAATWCVTKGLAFNFPFLRASYYDGDSWVEPIRHARLPAHVTLRHRLWTSVKEPGGQVDIIASPADERERARFVENAPEGAIVSPFSRGRGVQVSLRLPEMRQASGFNRETTSAAFSAMSELVDWYLHNGHDGRLPEGSSR